MKIFKMTITRPGPAVAFPEMISGALMTHVRAAYTQCDPIKMVGIEQSISDDLLTFTVSRTFATDADALEFSTDPQIVAWLESQEAELAANNITRIVGLSEV